MKPCIASFATTAALNYVKNKVADVSTLVKKADYDTKIGEIKKKLDHYHDHSNQYITTQEFNTLRTKNFAAKLKQAKLVTKADIANLVKKKNTDDELKKLNKQLLQIKQNMYWLKINKENYKHTIQVFLLVEVTFSVLDQKIS